MQLIFFKLWIKKFRDINVRDHLQTLAVVVNDWCSDDNGKIIFSKYKSLVGSYNINRPITKDENTFWGHALISAALRFYLSRLLDLHFPKIGEMTHVKDPLVFENILIDRLDTNYETISNSD